MISVRRKSKISLVTMAGLAILFAGGYCLGSVNSVWFYRGDTFENYDLGVDLTEIDDPAWHGAASAGAVVVESDYQYQAGDTPLQHTEGWTNDKHMLVDGKDGMVLSRFEDNEARTVVVDTMMQLTDGGPSSIVEDENTHFAVGLSKDGNLMIRHNASEDGGETWEPIGNEIESEEFLFEQDQWVRATLTLIYDTPSGRAYGRIEIDGKTVSDPLGWSGVEDDPEPDAGGEWFALIGEPEFLSEVGFAGAGGVDDFLVHVPGYHSIEVQTSGNGSVEPMRVSVATGADAEFHLSADRFHHISQLSTSIGEMLSFPEDEMKTLSWTWTDVDQDGHLVVGFALDSPFDFVVEIDAESDISRDEKLEVVGGHYIPDNKGRFFIDDDPEDSNEGKLGDLHMDGHAIRHSVGSKSNYLFLDVFEDGDLATAENGINGGFATDTANLASITAVEEDSRVLIQRDASAGPGGIISLNSVDLSEQPQFTVNFEVLGALEGPDSLSGHFLGLQENDGFYRDIRNFGFRLWISGGHYTMQFLSNEQREASPLHGTEIVLDEFQFSLDSYLGGFTASFTVDASGWSYEVEGLSTTEGEPALFSNSSTWVDSGAPENFFELHFDTDYHLCAWMRNRNTATEITLGSVSLSTGVDAGAPPRDVYEFYARSIFGGGSFIFDSDLEGDSTGLVIKTTKDVELELISTARLGGEPGSAGDISVFSGGRVLVEGGILSYAENDAGKGGDILIESAGDIIIGDLVDARGSSPGSLRLESFEGRIQLSGLDTGLLKDIELLAGEEVVIDGEIDVFSVDESSKTADLGISSLHSHVYYRDREDANPSLTGVYALIGPDGTPLGYELRPLSEMVPIAWLKNFYESDYESMLDIDENDSGLTARQAYWAGLSPVDETARFEVNMIDGNQLHWRSRSYPGSEARRPFVLERIKEIKDDGRVVWEPVRYIERDCNVEDYSVIVPRPAAGAHIYRVSVAEQP